jgi:hypothetical protein
MADSCIVSHTTTEDNRSDNYLAIGCMHVPLKTVPCKRVHQVADLRKAGQEQEDASEIRAYTKGQVKSQAIHRAS